MLELEDHVQLGPLAVRIFPGLFKCHARRLSDRHDVEFREHLLIHFLYVLVDMRPVRRTAAVAVEFVHERRVGQSRRLGDQADDIHAETVDALLAPARHHVEDFLSHRRVIPVEVGLLFGEQMQVVHIRRRVILPRGPGEPGAPVVGLFAVLSLPPDVVIPLGIFPGGTALYEPPVFVGGVIDDQVHHYFDPAFMRRRQHPVKILHRAELVHDRLVIADVVTVVVVGRLVDRGEPDHVDPKLLQVIQLRRDPVQVADAVAVAVHEAAGIDLINNTFFPPGLIHTHLLRAPCRTAPSAAGSFPPGPPKGHRGRSSTSSCSRSSTAG